jgi:hypothetical protein
MTSYPPQLPISLEAAHSALALQRPGAQETVMPFTRGLRGHASAHEQATREELVRRLADIKGCAYSKDELPQPIWHGRTYLVPSDTLVGIDTAHALGVHGQDDLFGGVVPHGFIATKAITHPLVAFEASAPEGWNPEFARLVKRAVLPGYAAFSRADALRAGKALFALGPLRVKPVGETGGRGQTVVTTVQALQTCLAMLGDSLLEKEGVVLEHNLTEVETLSIGQVRVAGLQASYYGLQRLTPDNGGAMVYGGSDLTVVRGDFNALLARTPSGPLHDAVVQALDYDEAVRTCYPGFFASRINYDVAQGLNAAGQWCSGVLEQSWRVGGASGAEVAALEAFHQHPDLRMVRACCVEKFGPPQAIPVGAVLYYQGIDPEAGPLTKYTTLEIHDHTA